MGGQLGYAAFGEFPLDGSYGGFVNAEGNLQSLGDGGRGDVILRGAQPAGGDDYVGTPQRVLERRDQPPRIIPHCGFMKTINPQLGEFLRQEGCIGINSLTQQEFCSY